ncbi:response regulator [Siccirubricoccus sp. G192]|nr:response regulator [Siccirubricoccus sp. G192]
MPQGGELRIAAEADTAPGLRRPPGLAPEAPPGSYLRIAVTDSGTGMDAATLARATEPFFTTKGPGKGSGLGLSMVHGLAAQSGGQLRILSEAGAGTTVELWLPVDAGAVAAAAEPPAPPAVEAVATRPLHILLVDDDPLIQAGTAAMLEDLGHHVLVAASGAAALETLAREPCELLVTDFAMPGMTGLELAQEVRRRWPGLPMILATGFAELLPGEGDDLPRLAKPYRQEDLAATIAQVMRRAG